MNKETQIKHINAFTEKMKAVIVSKREDYAQDSDTLSNFKQVAKMCGITPELVILVFVATKVARLGVLLNSKKPPNNESINDSLLDLANYSALLEMVGAENAVEKVVDQVRKIKPDVYCDTYCAFNESCDRIDCVGSCK